MSGTTLTDTSPGPMTDRHRLLCPAQISEVAEENYGPNS